jgi:riboflavin biosynthesis RibT protein
MFMLVPYKKEHEKIAMGLLSFMPGEKKIKKLQQTVDHYETDPDCQLFLWKQEAFVGVIGVEKSQDSYVLKDLSVNPSYRNEGVATKMIQAAETALGAELLGTRHTKDFLEHCKEK